MCSSDLIEAAAGTGIALLSMSDDQVTMTGRTRLVIPAGTYAGVDEDVVTTSLPVIAYTTTEMSDETAYELTRAYWSGKDAMGEDAAWWNAVTGAMLANVQGQIHAGALRYYDEVGLVVPARSDSGYRDYSGADVHRLRFLQRARTLGFTIEQCRDLMSLYADTSRASHDVKAMVQTKLVEIDRKLAELVSLRDTLETLAGACRGDDRPDCPILDDLAGTHDSRRYRGALRPGSAGVDRPNVAIRAVYETVKRCAAADPDRYSAPTSPFPDRHAR